jgi:hypothetical protein
MRQSLALDSRSRAEEEKETNCLGVESSNESGDVSRSRYGDVDVKRNLNEEGYNEAVSTVIGFDSLAKQGRKRRCVGHAFLALRRQQNRQKAHPKLVLQIVPPAFAQMNVIEAEPNLPEPL